MQFEVKIIGSTLEEAHKIASLFRLIGGGTAEIAGGEEVAETTAPKTRKKKTPEETAAAATTKTPDPLGDDDGDDDLLGDGGAVSYTIPQVQQAIKDLLEKDKGLGIKMKKILNDMGVANATALSPGQCGEFMEALKKLK